MQFGIYLSTINEFSDPNLLAELAREAEHVGWDGVFIYDHIGQPSKVADPWIALSAMATRTKRVKLGPVVTPVARRRPWKLARETVTLDHLSSGRLILGVGLGWSPLEFETFGETGNARTRAEKLDEGLTILAGLWSGELFRFNGKHNQINDIRFLPKPVQTPRIPIWVCGTWSDKKAPFRRAARWDGIIPISPASENRAISPQEVLDIKAYIKRHRDNNNSFDITVILWSAGEANESDQVREYKRAGVTWWLEDLSTERYTSVEEVRHRLHKGLPGQYQRMRTKE
jgi:alkanesulfonate monooxygenase SsuD/methylene tetrahydromethanopterin reductase-like flavin-dependent oxidoreductase (luciferase family)